jgi:hypothetical protein
MNLQEFLSKNIYCSGESSCQAEFYSAGSVFLRDRHVSDDHRPDTMPYRFFERRYPYVLSRS